MGKKKNDDDDLYVYDGCIKVRDPCKICLQTVNSKTGLQCQGACEAWVHFACLNYTPGKILDVNNGAITITCPCPDCKTTVPKEYLTETPFACNNVQCPANNPPCCEDPYCQANELARAMPARCAPPGTLRQCGGRLCIDNSGPSTFQSTSGDACMQGYSVKTRCGDNEGTTQVPMPPTLPTYPPPAEGRPGAGLPLQTAGMPGAGLPLRTAGMPGAGLPLQTAGRPGGGLPPQTADVMQEMCKTVENLAKQLNSLMENLKSQPQSEVCGTSGSCGGNAGCKKCSNTSPPAVITKKQCSGGCGAAGQSRCSDPCHCPGNPLKR